VKSDAVRGEQRRERRDDQCVRRAIAVE